jgi:hypothetical protein
MTTAVFPDMRPCSAVGVDVSGTHSASIFRTVRKNELKYKAVPVLNQAPRHEDAWEMEEYLHGGEWSASRPGRFISDWVGCRDCAEDKNILPLPTARRPRLGRVSHRGLLFGTRYSGHARREKASSCRRSLKDTARLTLTGILLRF